MEAGPAQDARVRRLPALGRWPAFERALTLGRRALVETPVLGVVVALVLGLYRIGDKSIWLDEAFSINITRLPTIDLFAWLVRFELHQSPYLVVLHVWRALGESEAAVRTLSVAFGVVAVLATFAIARRFGVAWVAALLLAVSPSFVEYEQEARAYTMLIAWSALATLAWVWLTERWSLPRAVIYVALAGSIVYVHPLSGLIIVAHALATLVFVAPEVRRRTLVLCVPILVIWLPMIVFAVRHRDTISWIEQTTVAIAARDLTTAAGGPLVAGALAVLLVMAVRRDMPTIWLLVPIVGTLAISFLLTPALQPKYLLGALPAAAVICSRNRMAAVALLIALSIVGVGAWYSTGRKDDWRAGVEFVVERVQPGDGVVFASPNMREPFGYYAQVGDPLYPATPWSQLYLRSENTADLAGIEARDRIWLVQGHGRYAPPEVWAALAAFDVVITQDYGGSAPFIQLLERHESQRALAHTPR